MNKIFKVLVIVFSTLLLVSCSGSNNNSTSSGVGDGSSNFIVTKKHSIPISVDNLEATYEKAKIKFSSNDIETAEVVSIQKMIPKSMSLGGEVGTNYKALGYDFSVEGKTDFTDLIQITLGYDSDFVDAIGDEKASIVAKYYNPQTGAYEPVDYEVDTSKNEVTILTNHLSTYALISIPKSESYGAFKVINNNSRKAYITDVDPYYKFINSYTASDIINESLDNDMVSGTQAYEAGFNAANEWLGLTAASNGLTSAPFSSTFLKSLSNSFNHLGLGASVLQAAFDFSKGDIVSLYANLSKNVVYNSVNYFGTSALQLAFVGVFAIDYSLTAFANEAWDGSNEKWYKTYNQCYKKHFAKKQPQWYKVFYWIWHDTQDIKQAKEKIDKAIWDNAFAVWDKLSESDRVECMDDLGYVDLGGASSSLEIMLAMSKKSELVAELQPTFNRLEKVIILDMRAKYKIELKKLQDQLNQIIKVKIQETIPEGSSSKYAGYRFRFAPLNDKAKKSEWTGILDSDGSASGAWRVLGYMQAGSPNRLELFKPTDDPDIATPVKTVEFTTDPPNLVINLKDEKSYVAFSYSYDCYYTDGEYTGSGNNVGFPELTYVVTITPSGLKYMNNSTYISLDGSISNNSVDFTHYPDSVPGVPMSFSGAVSSGLLSGNESEDIICKGSYKGKYITEEEANKLNN